MKLYLYDHCPYCVRVVMGFRLKGLPVEMIYVPYDDAETPSRMIGRKMLPILADADGFMGESLDILRKIDAMTGPRLFDQPARTDITGWIDDWKATIYGLVLPRVANSAFPEFQSAAARQAFTAAKQNSYGPFGDLLAQTDILLADMTRGLEQLASILPDSAHCGLNDIHIFPMLRSLRVVERLSPPRYVRTYYQRIVSEIGSFGRW